MIELLLLNHSKMPMPRQFLQKWWRAVYAELPKKDQKRARGLEVSLVFLDEKAARQLNKEYRQRDYPTDVLSFVGDGQGQLGDLAICPAVVKRQAEEHGLTFRAELGYMVLHGLLHLLGYDHEGSKAEAQRMFALQDRIFAQLQGLITRG